MDTVGFHDIEECFLSNASSFGKELVLRIRSGGVDGVDDVGGVEVLMMLIVVELMVMTIIVVIIITIIITWQYLYVWPFHKHWLSQDIPDTVHDQVHCFSPHSIPENHDHNHDHDHDHDHHILKIFRILFRLRRCHDHDHHDNLHLPSDPPQMVWNAPSHKLFHL